MKLAEVIIQDTRANQPLATAVPPGTLYGVTDEGNIIERSDGTAWQDYSPTVAASGLDQLTGDVTAGPGTGSQVATIANDAITSAKILNDAIITAKILNDAITTAKILNAAITYAKMQDVSAISKLLGRGAAAGAGDVEEITLGTNLSMSGTTLNAAGGGSGLDQLTGDVTAGPGSGSQAATIPNNIVTYAKIQDVSAISKLLGRGSAAGAGDPQEITLGTNLTMSGTTLNAAGGGGAAGLVLLEVEIASASAELVFTSFSSAYDIYKFEISALKAASAFALIVQFSSNGGSSWLTTFSYKYSYRLELLGSPPTNSVGGANNDSFNIYEAAVNTTGPGIFGEFTLYDPLAAAYTYAAWNTMGRSNVPAENHYTGGGFYESSAVINAVKFQLYAGNLTSGSIRMYGLAKT